VEEILENEKENEVSKKQPVSPDPHQESFISGV